MFSLNDNMRYRVTATRHTSSSNAWRASPCTDAGRMHAASSLALFRKMRRWLPRPSSIFASVTRSKRMPTMPFSHLMSAKSCRHLPHHEPRNATGCQILLPRTLAGGSGTHRRFWPSNIECSTILRNDGRPNQGRPSYFLFWQYCLFYWVKRTRCTT